MADTLKEFLVNIGYHIDETSENKFLKGIGGATEKVIGLGEQVVLTALAIQVGVSKMANDFERLYYSSQRTSSAVSAIQAVGYAFTTVGLSSDQAKGSIESLMSSIRNNPGISALLNNLGVRTKGRQGTEIFDDTIKRLSQMPFYVARQYASLLGVEDSVLLQLINNYKKFSEARDDATKRRSEAGLDPKKQAADAVVYNNALRSLMLTLDILAERIYSGFIGPATRVVTILDDLARGFINIDKATNGWAGALATVGTTSLGLYLAKLLLMKTLFRGVAVEAASAAAATALATGGKAAVTTKSMGVGGTIGRALVGRGGGVLGGALMAMLGMKYDSEHGNRGRSWLRNQLGIQDDPNEPAPWQKKGSPPASGPEKIIDYFMGQGWTRAQSTGIATNLHRESKFDPKAVGDGGQAYGVAQWHPDRQENFRKWSGKDIRESTLEDQLGFVHHELTKGAEAFAGAMLRKTTTAGEAGAAVSRYYERPANVAGEMSGRSVQAQMWYDQSKLGDDSRTAKAPEIHQQTNISVATADPNVAAKKTAEAQGSVNAEIVRNLGAVTR